MSKSMGATLVAGGKDVSERYETFLTHLSPKGRGLAEKHLELCESQTTLGFGKSWKRLVGALDKLASHLVEAPRAHVVRFYIADGKYRKQVFALEDELKGIICVYLPDVTAIAVQRKLLRVVDTKEGIYEVPQAAGQQIVLQGISAYTDDLPEFCKPMLGWGRKAVRTQVPAQATDRCLAAVEMLCELAAEDWKNNPPAEIPTPANGAKIH